MATVTDKGRQLIAEAQKRSWSNPETKVRRAQAISEGQKAAWADPTVKAARVAKRVATMRANKARKLQEQS